MFGTLVCSKYTRQQQEQQFVSTWILEHQYDCRHFVFTIEINVKLDGMKRKLGVPMVCIREWSFVSRTIMGGGTKSFGHHFLLFRYSIIKKYILVICYFDRSQYLYDWWEYLLVFCFCYLYLQMLCIY